MPPPPLSEEVARQTAEFYNKYIRQGYRPLGVSGSGPTAFSMACQDAISSGFIASRTTFQNRLHTPIVKKYVTVGGQTPATPRIEHEPVPSADEPIEDVIARAEQRFIRAKAAHDANRWRTVRMRGDGPMAIVWFGDPHLDSPGCDWLTLKRDIELVKNTEGVFAANAGDTIDNWVGRLTKLKGKSSVSDSDAWRMAEWFMNELSDKWIAWVLGNHDCLSMDTQALTKRGWKFYDELVDGDEVVGLTPSGSAVWQPIQKKFERPSVSGEMLSWGGGRRMDMVVTKGHRVLFEQRQNDKSWSSLKYAAAGELPLGRLRVRTAATIEAKDCGLSEDWLYLLGFLSADGGKDANGYWRVYQSKASPKLDAVLDRLGLKYSLHTRIRTTKSIVGRELKKPPLKCREYVFSAEASRAITAHGATKTCVPYPVQNGSQQDVAHYLAGVIDGDGTPFSSGKGAQIYGTKEFLDQLQARLITAGWAAVLCTNNRGDHVLSVCTRTTWQTETRPEELFEYSGNVWCLEVPHTNFLARRNGRSFFTGNCWNEGSFIFKRLKGRIVEMDDWQARLILKFDNDRECRVHMSHDFPGHSMYNPLHAQKRADLQSMGDAQVYLAGHRHETALSRYPCPIRGKPIIYGRAMGYKAIDDYGAKLGYSRQNEGESIVLVFDPDAETEADFIHGFTTVPSAIQYLGHLRQKHKEMQRKGGARAGRTR